MLTFWLSLKIGQFSNVIFSLVHICHTLSHCTTTAEAIIWPLPPHCPRFIITFRHLYGSSLRACSTCNARTTLIWTILLDWMLEISVEICLVMEEKTFTNYMLSHVILSFKTQFTNTRFSTWGRTKKFHSIVFDWLNKCPEGCYSYNLTSVRFIW